MTENEIPTATEISRDDQIKAIASILLNRRKERNLTLDRVSQTLKIRIPYLKALEEAKWDEIPGEVYVRGFLTRYAQYLGLDAEKIVNSYFIPPSQKREATKKSKSAPTSDETDQKTIVIYIGIALFVVVGLIKLIRSDLSRVEPVPVAQPPVVVESTTTKPSAIPVSTVAAPVVVTHTLTLFCPDELWVSIRTTPRPFEGFVTPQGSTWTWKGDSPFNIKLGHTLGVTLTFDGQVVNLTEDQKKITLPSPNAN